jgi:hypothetical protein
VHENNPTTYLTEGVMFYNIEVPPTPERPPFSKDENQSTLSKFCEFYTSRKVNYPYRPILLLH